MKISSPASSECKPFTAGEVNLDLGQICGLKIQAYSFCKKQDTYGTNLYTFLK